MSRPHFTASCRGPGLLLALALGVFLWAPRQVQAQSAVPKEYQLKAAFLFHFLQFVEWPEAATTNDPVRIGLLGDDPFGTALEEVVRGEAINGRKLTISRSKKIEDLKDCQLVFVSKSEKGQVPEVLAQLETLPVLTVGETDGFARRGGIINFYLEGKKVRFEINVAKARSSGLKISSQLLSLGKLVEPDAAKGGP